MAPERRKSDAYVEAMVREAVSQVEACIKTPLEDLGYAGPHTRLELTDGQHDFLAGYIYGALERLLEMGELDTEDDVELAANRLYARLLGPFDTEDLRTWHMWVVREGIKQVQRPHAMLGYCAAILWKGSAPTTSGRPSARPSQTSRVAATATMARCPPATAVSNQTE